MTRYFLTRVRIEGFRGINNEGQPLELRFRPDCVNSVFAVNGTGKSSIFEALHYAIRGTVPRLEKLQAGEYPQSYVANLFHSTGVAFVELDLQDEAGTTTTILVSRDRTGRRLVNSPSGAADPERILRSLDEDFTLLDYAQFLDFLDNTPLKRGRTFASLLGLSSYSQNRMALQTLCDPRNLNADFQLQDNRVRLAGFEQEALGNLTRFAGALENLTGCSHVREENIFSHAAEILEVLSRIDVISPVVTNRRLSEIDFEEVRALVQAAEGGPARTELASVVAALAQLQAISSIDEAAQEAEIETLKTLVVARDESFSQTRGQLYHRLHQAARALLSGGDWPSQEVCPLCGENIPPGLAERISAQLASYESVDRYNAQIRGASSQAWLSTLAELEAMPRLEVAPEARIAGKVLAAMRQGEFTVRGLEEAVSRRETLLLKRSAEVVKLSERKAQLEKELPPSLVAVTTQIEVAREAREALHAYWEASRGASQISKRLANYERWSRFVAAVHQGYCEAETALTQARLDEIETTYQLLFQKIMRTTDIVPELVRNERGEHLNVLLADFHGLSDRCARALLSESFSNALAISIFLSAAVRHSGSPKFVVLDDVTSSFDSGHQWQLMERIRSELQFHDNRPDGLQFIILSHDGLLEKYFDRLSGQANWRHQKLQGLPPKGAITVSGQSATRLRDTADAFLQSGQVVQAEPLVRQYLEHVLLQIINKVQIPVPLDFAMKDSQQMVQNCIDAIVNAFTLYRDAGKLVLEPQQVKDFEQVHLPAVSGNYLAHYATGVSASITPRALMGVLDAVDAIAECFQYDTNSGPPTRRWYRSLARR